MTPTGRNSHTTTVSFLLSLISRGSITVGDVTFMNAIFHMCWIRKNISHNCVQKVNPKILDYINIKGYSREVMIKKRKLL